MLPSGALANTITLWVLLAPFPGLSVSKLETTIIHL